MERRAVPEARSHRTLTAICLIGAAAVIAFLFEAYRALVPGRSWAGLAVQASLLLWPFAVLLYQARRFISRAWRGVSWTLAIFAALMAVVLPIAVLWFLDPPVALWIALVVIVGPPIGAFLLLSLLRAHLVEAAARRATALAASKRSDAEDKQAQERPRGALAIASIGCAVASSLLLLGSAIRVPIERQLLETSQVAERGAILPPVDLENPDAPTGADRQSLLERYSPVLRLHDREAWIAYDASAAVSIMEAPPREDCAESGQRPCSELALEGALHRLVDPHPPARTRVFAGGSIYPRLVEVRGEIRTLGEQVPVIARATRWLAKYWLFYPYNDWRAKTAVGPLEQVHGGDWEWVGVGLNAAAAPLFVAYSAHCAGTWRPWKSAALVAVEGRRVMVGSTAESPASHPLVIVALGSHANYATPGAREPDWGSCLRRKSVARALRWLTFAVAAREETPDLGPFQLPVVLSESDTAAEANRALWWGEGGRTQLGPIELFEDEHGPASPVYKEAWNEPINTIFGSGWECDGSEGCGGP